MFKLEENVCNCTSTSKNSENMGAGGDTRLGVSLYFEFDANNESLDMLDMKLRPALYERAANDAQQDLTGHMPVCKFALDEPIKWPWIGMGYKVVLHADLEFSTDFELSDCKIDKIQLTPKNDGVVGYKFRIYCHPELKDIGPICALEKHSATVTLIPPPTEYIAPDPVKKGKGKKAAQAANDGQGDLVTNAAQEEIKDAVSEAPVDPLYVKAVAAVRATKNPNTQALMTELRLSINDAARYIMRMQEEGIIRKDDDGDEFVVVDEEQKNEAAA